MCGLALVSELCRRCAILTLYVGRARSPQEQREDEPKQRDAARDREGPVQPISERSMLHHGV